MRYPRELPCSQFCQDSETGKEPWLGTWDSERNPSHNPMPLNPLTEPHQCTRLHRPRRSLDFHYSTAVAEHTEPSSHHSLILQTAERPTTTIDDTLDSFWNAGLASWPGPQICSSDGPSKPIHLPSWYFCRSPRRDGAARAFLRSLRLALAVDPDLNLLTFIEDDVELCKNALAYAAQVKIPTDIAFVTWFTYDYDWCFPRHPVLPNLHPNDVFRETSRAVLACRPARYFILTQMVTFTRETVERILACPRVSRHWPKLDGHDELIAWALGDATYAAHFPVLVQHRGGLSSAVALARTESGAKTSDAQEGARESSYYVGRDFDALTLLEKR